VFRPSGRGARARVFSYMGGVVVVFVCVVGWGGALFCFIGKLFLPIYWEAFLPICREDLFTHRGVKVHKIIDDKTISLYNNPKPRA